MSTSKPADQLAAMAGSTTLTDKMEAEVQRLLDVSTRSGVHRRMSSFVFFQRNRDLTDQLDKSLRVIARLRRQRWYV